jgi:hypothetical protein
MTKVKQLLLGTSMAAVFAGLSGPANAIIEGAAGEALLVPFVLFDGNDPNLNPTGVNINTLIEVTVPASVGQDTVPNFFTATNTTPTNLGALEFPPAEALGAPGAFEAGIHLYFFTKDSVEACNIEIPTSPDDFIMINWGDVVQKNCQFLNGVAGYVVITNQKTGLPTSPTYYPQGDRSAAQFAMMGDAFMVWPVGLGLIDTKIPVLPMTDGLDPATGGVPTPDNQVVLNGGKLNVSPLAAGMRTNISNGLPGDYTLFDLTVSNRFAPTLHVIWVDRNLPGNFSTGFTYDDDENRCSQTLPIQKELQIYWTSPPYLWPGNFLTRSQNKNPNFVLGKAGAGISLPWVDAALDLCYPDPGAFVFNPGKPGDLFEILESRILYPGFVLFRLDEYVDTGVGQPESSAVAFSIQLQVDILDEDGLLLATPQLLPVETALGHERGKFQP